MPAPPWPKSVNCNFANWPAFWQVKFSSRIVETLTVGCYFVGTKWNTIKCCETARGLKPVLDHRTQIQVAPSMTETEHVSALQGRSYTELQQWVHDLRTPLSVISMGIDALRSVRHDDQQFKELFEMISREGIGPLNRMLDQLGNDHFSKPN